MSFIKILGSSPGIGISLHALDKAELEQQKEYRKAWNKYWRKKGKFKFQVKATPYSK